MTPFCSFCGAAAPMAARFCSHCGQALRPVAAPVSPPPAPAFTALDLEAVTARTKSYSGHAVCVFLLYWFFWIPGFVANLIYVSEANAMEERAGGPLPGVGALRFMLTLQYWLIGLFALFMVLGVLFSQLLGRPS